MQLNLSVKYLLSIALQECKPFWKESIFAEKRWMIYTAWLHSERLFSFVYITLLRSHALGFVYFERALCSFIYILVYVLFDCRMSFAMYWTFLSGFVCIVYFGRCHWILYMYLINSVYIRDVSLRMRFKCHPLSLTSLWSVPSTIWNQIP